MNEVICHGIPDDRALEEGDIVNLDISVYAKGVHSDLNETYCVGKVSDSSKFLVILIRFPRKIYEGGFVRSKEPMKL